MTPENLSQALKVAVRTAKYWARTAGIGDRGLVGQEDLAQEARFRVWRNHGRFDPSKATLQTWAYNEGRWAAQEAVRSVLGRPGREKLVFLETDPLCLPEQVHYDPESQEDLDEQSHCLLHPYLLSKREKRAVAYWLSRPISQRAAARYSGLSDSEFSNVLRRMRAHHQNERPSKAGVEDHRNFLRLVPSGPNQRVRTA